MRCREFETRLQDVLDARGSLVDDCELAAHAAGCPNCRELVAAYDTLFDALTASSPAPPRRHADQVLCELARRESFSSRRYLSLAAAAALLLVASVSLWRFGTREQDDSHLVATPATNQSVINAPQAAAMRPAVELIPAAPISSPAPTVPAPVVVQTERELAPERAFFVTPADGYTELARETGRGVATLVKTLPRLRLDSLGDLAPERTAQPAQWMSQVTDGIGPLTSSMAEALESLLRAITPPADPAQDAQAS